MENKTLEQEIEELSNARNQARNIVIGNKKYLLLEEQKYFNIKSAYEKAVKSYMDLDRQLALALNRQKQSLIKPKTKSYNYADRTLQKAIKQLSSLPQEMREKILADMKDNLF